jgi:UDP-N-acetylglucosamine:LPS N-acetylglucosamine transferase
VIALLGAGPGGGHRAVMAALAEEALTREGPRARVVAYPQTDALVGTIGRLARFGPATARRMAEARLRYRLAARLEADAADAVIVTHPSVAADAIAAADGGGAARPTCFAVCTDPGAWVRPGWAQRGFARVFAATEAARRALIARGLVAERVEVAGLPVRRRFFGPPALPRERVLQGLRLATGQPVALVVSSARVRASDEHVVRAVLEAHPSLQVVHVCASGATALRQAVRRARTEPRLAVVAHTRELELFLSTADVVVTSPGGAVVLEAAACRVPVVAWLRPGAPQQRTATAALLERYGLGMRAGAPDEITAAVRRMVASARAPQLCADAGALRRASAGAAAAILDRLAGSPVAASR